MIHGGVRIPVHQAGGKSTPSVAPCGSRSWRSGARSSDGALERRLQRVPSGSTKERAFSTLSRNNQFAVAVRCCGRQWLSVMDEFDDRAQRVVPVLFLPAANRQHVVEAKAGILLPNRNIGSRLFVESPRSMTFFASCICPAVN
jgi:hypothetical protein